MKRITHHSLACSAVLALAIVTGLAVSAHAATPTPSSAVTKTRIFNDCPTSTITVTNNYPSNITIADDDLDCFGFANLHNWRFSENGTTPAQFDNASTFRFAADLVISGTGNGEAGLQISPWWSPDVDGRFNVRTPDGEIAVFGGRLPFYSFTGGHGINYVAGETIRLEMRYDPNGTSAAKPATIEYLVTYHGTTYSSGRLPFDQGNPAEDPPHGQWGMLQPAEAGGYFQPRLGNGSNVLVTASWSNIEYGSTPDPNSAVTHTRIFNDCPTSNLTVTNNYPSEIAFDDQNVDCFGFANLHNWHFSEDGTNDALFNNNSRFRFSADLVITGNGEGGLQVSPWWSPDVDGRFNVRSTDGEIACFGGRLPFYSFTGAHGLRYTKGEPIHLDIKYFQHSQTSLDPATIEYTVIYQGASYTSGQLPFDGANPAEDPPYGQWGMLNGGRAGGYFQVFLGNGNDVSAKASFRNIRFSRCLELVAVPADLKPSKINLKAKSGHYTATLYPPSPYTGASFDLSSITLNGVPVDKSSVKSDKVTLKFDRAAVTATLPQGSKIPVLVTGSIGSECFESLEFINVKSTQASSPPPAATFAPGQTIAVAWPVPAASASKVSLLASYDGGETWSVVVASTNNDGSHNWTAPNVSTNRARISVAVLGTSDEFGLVTEEEVAETGDFSILTPAGVGDAGDLSFAIRGVQPNPARGPLNVSFSLPSRDAATLGVFDVSGRQVISREVGGLGAGRHTLTLGGRGTFRPGIYMIRLTQGGRSVSLRAAVIE